jgi:hypothetical protein
MMGRSSMKSQLVGNRVGSSSANGGNMVSTGDDAKDLAIVRMGKGGKTKSRVNEAGNYTKPSLRKRLFNKIKSGGKGGKPGQWSARKAQMLAKQYKGAGGGYRP